MQVCINKKEKKKQEKNEENLQPQNNDKTTIKMYLKDNHRQQ